MATLTRKHSLIHGFIRHITLQLKTIPVEVINFCCLFYCTPFTIIASSHHSNKLCLANIENKTLFDLITTKIPNTTYNISSICYIPKISQYISTIKNRHYDGIIGICEYNSHSSTSNPTYNASLLLFDSNKTDNNQIVYRLLKSSEPMPNIIDTDNYIPPELIYCNNNNSVICYHQDGLYKLKLEDINLHTKQFNFSAMDTQNSIDLYNLCTGSMGYIHNENKLFAMDGIRKQSGWEIEWELRLNANKRLNENRRCSIFDFNTQQWNSVTSFKYAKYRKQGVLSTGICQGNVYNVNNVYIVSNIGHVIKYDMCKNIWDMLLEDIDNRQIQFDQKPVVWFYDNPYVLYMYEHDEYGDHYFGCLDIRDNNRKWIISAKMRFMFDEMKESYRMCLHC
eukprot:164811_1